MTKKQTTHNYSPKDTNQPHNSRKSPCAITKKVEDSKDSTSTVVRIVTHHFHSIYAIVRTVRTALLETLLSKIQPQNIPYDVNLQN
jgi:hypothetical protein